MPNGLSIECANLAQTVKKLKTDLAALRKQLAHASGRERENLLIQISDTLDQLASAEHAYNVGCVPRPNVTIKYPTDAFIIFPGDTKTVPVEAVTDLMTPQSVTLVYAAHGDPKFSAQPLMLTCQSGQPAAGSLSVVCTTDAAQGPHYLQFDVKDSRNNTVSALTLVAVVDRLLIADIETTQAIQFFQFNGQGSGAGPNNSIPLIAGKDLICRVYMDAPKGFLVGGYMSYVGSTFGATNIPPINNNSVSILSGPGAIDSLRASSIDRGNPNHTLNFRIPGIDCHGLLNIDFDLRGAGVAHKSILVDFKAVSNPNIHAVLVNYTGKNSGTPINIPAPTMTDFLNVFAYVRKVYPVSNFTYSGFDVIQFNGDLTAPIFVGTCGPAWNALLSTLDAMRAASSSSAVYVAIVPSGPAYAAGGCGGGGPEAASIAGLGSNFAQETGHAYGRQHAPGCNALGVDPQYPVYGSYPSASIGEYGFDGSTSKVFDPNVSSDFMSYCGNNWVSPYTYMALMNVFAPDRIGVSDRPETRTLKGHHLYIEVQLHREGSVTLLSAFHLPDMSAPRANEYASTSAVSCELQDASGKTLVFHRCGVTNPLECCSGPYTIYREVMHWHPDATQIAFFRDSNAIGTLSIEHDSPQVQTPTIVHDDKHDHLISLEWADSHLNDTTSRGSSKEQAQYKKAQSTVSHKSSIYLVRYSYDGGATWRALAANLTEPKLAVNLDLLPGGHACVFQIVASSGIRTTLSQTEPISVGLKPTQVLILHPEAGSEYKRGEPVRFEGAGYSPDYGMVPMDDMQWISNLDGLIGTGHEIFVQSLSPGRHRITLNCSNGAGGEATKDTSIIIRR